VLEEVILLYQQQGRSFETACCIYPTAPLLSPAALQKGYQLLQEKNYDSLFPVLRFSFPIWRSLKLEEGKVHLNWPEYLNHRSQDLPPAFHDAGQFYWFNIASFRTKQALYTDNTGALELDELEVQDIDNETDWKLAELKYKLLHHLD